MRRAAMRERDEHPVTPWMRGLLAAAFVALIAAVVLDWLTPGIASAIVGLLFFASIGLIFVGGLVEERSEVGEELDVCGCKPCRDSRDELPSDETADDYYYGAVVAGDPVGRQSVREYARQIALRSWRVQEKAISNSRKRHARKQAKETSHG